MKSTINRRSWFKQSVLTTGGLITGAILAPELTAKPAFGMKPANKYQLLENYHVAPPDRENMKARLLANENPWGPSKKAIAAIAEAASKGNRYVYGSAMKMVEVLAEKEGVSKEQVLLAAGSTDLLEKTAFALCMKGGNVISADPSYMSLVNTATTIGASWKNIPLRSDYAHDLTAMEKAIDANTKLIYICNPNNPTGTLTPIEELKAFCKRVSTKVPVFIDEAYLELLDHPEAHSTVGLLKEGYDVIVCRTFSKIHGMAGLRLGYMVAKPERVKMIQDMVRTEMGISVTSLEGAMASMQDVDFQNFTRSHNKEGREYVFSELKRAGLNPIPSYTSFVLFPIQMPVKDMIDKMMSRGVGIRGYEIAGKPYGRVSVGTMDELKLFVKSLNEIVS
ncbi:pyridoxal phosphate-dependent aminotransferase [Chryseosolibacter indicus]|uniref:Histidinol-phosphate aminotransferase family protein n=1 Tax=Chryseosolibacter indicus TaxID=2782351 RepID=A0ABS5VSE8_9BACT|nr:histidinol-phosphate transaminase [Chryseosolibacter indicus]MBT1703699.1 histidinol-phosphate aminotransferase family protein [Chryseosolibacter indicus]